MGAVRRLTAHFVLTPQGLLRNIVVTVAGDGTILDLSRSDMPDGEHGVEFHSGILIPGMVNAHCHLELSHMKGMIPQDSGFAGFGTAMGECRDCMDIVAQQESASYHDAKMWSEGVSAVGDISNSGTTVDIKSQSLVNYHSFVEVYGLGVFSTQRFDALLRLMKERGLSASMTPHSMYSLNEGLLKGTIAGDDGALSVHFMESPGEKQLFGGVGEFREWYDRMGWKDDFSELYPSPAERLVRNVPVGRKILLIHNTFVEEEDIERVNGHLRGNVTWVLCPRSNSYITGSLPDVAMFRRKGCRIAVGTDSLASNTSLSLIEELKMFDAPMEEVLYWATKEGAKALGMEERIGTFERGKKPGVVVIEQADLNNVRLTADTLSRRLV